MFDTDASVPFLRVHSVSHRETVRGRVSKCNVDYVDTMCMPLLRSAGHVTLHIRVGEFGPRHR